MPTPSGVTEQSECMSLAWLTNAAESGLGVGRLREGWG